MKLLSRLLLNVLMVGILVWWGLLRPHGLQPLEGRVFLGLLLGWGASEWGMLGWMSRRPQPAGFPVPWTVWWVDRGIIVGVLLVLMVSLKGWREEPLAPLALGGFAVLGLVGIGLRVWAIQTLGSGFSQHLIATGPRVARGPYRFMAHPGYLGLVCVLVSLAGLLGSRTGMVLAVGGVGGLLGIRARFESPPISGAPR